MAKLSLFNRDEAKLYAAREFVFREGEPGDSMFVVQDGELEILVRDTVIETVGEGGVVGEMALIEKAPRSASVRAKTDAHVVAVNSKRFEFLVQQTPFFSLHIMKILAERIRNINKSL